jgi:hypothetical protein
VKKLLVRAKAICEAGGDWEHKNKLKVSCAAFKIFIQVMRQFIFATGILQLW